MLKSLVRVLVVSLEGNVVSSRLTGSQLTKRRTYGSASNAAASSGGKLPGLLTKKQAQDLVVKLTSEERELLMATIQECQSLKIKADFEGQLAAFRWRSKFGRPSSISSLGDVDPTGSYCTVPDDWLYRKYAETVPPPEHKDLMRVCVANAIPFIGFGFLDNFIMILAGDSIELSLGSVIALSTMAAAALGNTFSDIMGIGSAYYVELMAQRIGFEPPKLTPVQLDLPKTRLYANSGRVIGVTIGCLLGMFPLLFLSKEKNGDEKQK